MLRAGSRGSTPRTPPGRSRFGRASRMRRRAGFARGRGPADCRPADATPSPRLRFDRGEKARSRGSSARRADPESAPRARRPAARGDRRRPHRRERPPPAPLRADPAAQAAARRSIPRWRPGNRRRRPSRARARRVPRRCPVPWRPAPPAIRALSAAGGSRRPRPRGRPAPRHCGC